MKFDLHKRCARNHTTKRVTRNARGEIVKQWRAKLRVSRVMQVLERPMPLALARTRARTLTGAHAARTQVFKSSCLRESLRHSPASATFLMRRDHNIMTTGKSVRLPKMAKANAENTSEQQPRYAAKTAVCEVLQHRRAEGDFAPRTARE